MYKYEWDPETGGLVLNTSPLPMSSEPRPVYYRELEILGFDKECGWVIPQDDSRPIMWAEANKYWYRGRLVARTNGGSLFSKPKMEVIEVPEPEGIALQLVDIDGMVEKNKEIMGRLVDETIKKIYNTYVEFQDKVDVFYVAFSGGKDSVVTLDLVQRALPHNAFKVMFGDTGMEFSDTYVLVDKIERYCNENDIDFIRARSHLSAHESWRLFGPPASTNRWCCSVHKTSPQIAALRSSLSDQSVAGMAFTGIRASESAARAEYDDISDGAKHKGQRSRHVILDWNSAELFNYIYQEYLLINDAYKKGCGRVGCLLCPMSSSKYDFFKYYSYAEGSDRLIEAIKQTSGKTYFSDQEMLEFIDRGNWKSRRTGKELNIGNDTHAFELDHSRTISIIVQYIDDRWGEWGKTIGAFSRIDQNQYVIEYKGKNYKINLMLTAEGTKFTFPNAGSTKDDIKFVSLFRSVMIKSLYCVNCGVCVANCPNGCIEMGSSDLKISDSCTHCHLCHNINNHCLRYASIRNPKGGDAMTAKSLDRYYTFGIRKQWMDTYIKYSGSDGFWNSDGDGSVPNKKKSAFRKFLQDASIIPDSRTNTPTEFGQIVIKLGSDDLAAWALMLCNLAYTDAFGWYMQNVAFNREVTSDDLLEKLKDDMPKDTKGLGKRNYISAFKVILYKTPIGNEIGLGHCDASENDKGEISLRSITRTPWRSPDPKVILYSLYKFAEACGGYYQFSLSRLLDHDIDSDGISPTEIFGIDRETMEKILNGLSENYPDFINASFTHNLDTIDLRSEKTSLDVLKELF